MRPDYAAWILANYPTLKESMGQCGQAVKKMQVAFPELTATNGFVMILCGRRMHWWLKTADGEIVDPTAGQFNGIFDYEEIDDNHPARRYPQARCMDCGEYYYVTPELKGTMHTKACEDAFSAYLNGPR